MEGKILGNRYELLEKIGNGGMAVVYKAKCKLLNRLVAVKILRNEFVADKEFLTRFKVEAQAAASLSHPNIVPIYDVGNEGNIHYIVMEYINGITLKEYITQNGALPWRTAVNIAIQICSALEHAHNNHIVHRDIKPHNIIITKDLIAKVTDFGIARAVTASTLTLTGNAIGSVHYFSPEQARGGYTDEKSDIYSLGIVLYEMLTGKVPFDGDSPISIVLKHFEEEMIPPKQIVSSIPNSVNDIVLKATQKNKIDRYQSTSEMLEDLYKALKAPEENFVSFNNIDKQPTRRFAIGDVNEGIRGSDMLSDSQEEKTEPESVKNKSDRFTVIAALATAFVIIMLISGGIAYYFYTRISEPRTEIPAPSVVGLDINTARELLRQEGIELIIEDTKYDDKAPNGIILSQSPEPNKKMKAPGSIRVIISNGPEMVKVPNVIGKNYKEAEFELQKNGLVSKVSTEFSWEFPRDYVIRQMPLADSLVPKNSEVNIIVSAGVNPNKVKIPDLIGLLEEDAKKLLEQNNLLVGNIKYSVDKTKPYNTVLSQSILAGTEVDKLTKVDIVVNKFETSKDNESLKILSINLSNKKKKDFFVVKVETEDTNGRQVVYEKVHTKNDDEINIPISGKGSVIVRVYIDGELDSEQSIDFDEGR